MKLLYSFNKAGYEAKFWTKEIADASTDSCKFIPFNHGLYVDSQKCLRAQLLDNLYYEQDASLIGLYAELRRLLKEAGVNAILVDNCSPYHPEFLRTLDVYKILRTADGPIAAYDRDFAYVHAYDHILYHSPAYSRDLSMPEKLRYCGAKRADFWPLALFRAAYDPKLGLDELLDIDRDIDVVFVGALHLGKMADLARIKKHFGARFHLYGLCGLKRNLYFNAKYGFPGWVTPLPADGYARLYRRCKVGINIHNRGKYTIGNYRMFELPANGVLQVSDGDEYLSHFFEPDKEIVGFPDIDNLISTVEYYLSHDEARVSIVEKGYQAAMARHKFSDRMAQLHQIVEHGMRAAGSRQ
jgi:spore maturation protein CgeB